MLDLSIPASVTVPVAPGPGDDDPKSPAVVTAAAAAVTLGPGDDDHRSPVRVVGAATARGPHGPGESVGDNPDDDVHVLVMPAAGPGDAHAAPRSIVRFPKRRQTPPVAAVLDTEKE